MAYFESCLKEYEICYQRSLGLTVTVDATTMGSAPGGKLSLCGDEWASFCPNSGICYMDSERNKVCRCPRGVIGDFCKSWPWEDDEPVVTPEPQTPPKSNPAKSPKDDPCSDSNPLLKQQKSLVQSECKNASAVASYQSMMIVMGAIFATLYLALVLYFIFYVRYRKRLRGKEVFKKLAPIVKFKEKPEEAKSLNPLLAEETHRQESALCGNCGHSVSAHSLIYPSGSDRKRAKSLPPVFDAAGISQSTFQDFSRGFDPSCPQCLSEWPHHGRVQYATTPLLIVSGPIPASTPDLSLNRPDQHRIQESGKCLEVQAEVERGETSSRVSSYSERSKKPPLSPMPETEEDSHLIQSTPASPPFPAQDQGPPVTSRVDLTISPRRAVVGSPASDSELILEMPSVTESVSVQASPPRRDTGVNPRTPSEASYSNTDPPETDDQLIVVSDKREVRV